MKQTPALTIKAVNKYIKSKKNILQTTMFTIFWDFLIVEQIFLSPQVKGIYELIYEMPSDLKLLENIKTLQNFCLVLSPLTEMKTLSVLVKISWETDIELFP